MRLGAEGGDADLRIKTVVRGAVQTEMIGKIG